jgi:hypothetical protein
VITSGKKADHDGRVAGVRREAPAVYQPGRMRLCPGTLAGLSLVRLCVELDGRRRDGAWDALEEAVIGKAVDLLSGPGGLASFLRRRQLGVRLGGPSLPLDIGYAESVPAGIRNAVVLRDRKCRWAGGCDQPAAACQVHHTKHKANGGPTSVTDCVLLCPLCRYRHNGHYADLGIMPMPGFPALVAGVRVLSGVA